MKRVLAVLAVVSVIGWGAFALASAQEGKDHRPDQSQGMTGGMSGMMMGSGPAAEQPLISLALQNRDQLGLTSDQVKALESLRFEFQKEGTRRWGDLAIAEIELADLLRAESVDLAKVEAKVREIEGLRSELRLGRIKTLEKGKALLTPEQREKLKSIGLRASADVPGTMMAGRGMEEMQRFMHSERMPQAMTAMMAMARQMGNGDVMTGMVRMMEMMSMMGQMGRPDGRDDGARPTPEVDWDEQRHE